MKIAVILIYPPYFTYKVSFVLGVVPLIES